MGILYIIVSKWNDYTTMTVTMDGDKELVANFLTETFATHSLTVNPYPAAGGTVSKSPDKLDYATGEAVSVTATAYAGYTFTGWSGASSSKDATVTITMDDSKELIANFAPQTYTLTINTNPPDGGSVSSDPGKSAYTYNEQVTVTATAREDYEFTGWSGASSSTEASVTITMDENRELTAGFRQTGIVVPPSASYTLTVSASPANGGTVSTNPSKTSYNANDNVYVTAEAAEGYRFAGWSGASASQNAGVTITMDGDKKLIAIFELRTYTLTATANPSAYGSVSRNPDWTDYSHGTSVTVTASANSGYRFTKWTGASTSTSASAVITMDGNKTVTANFEQIPKYTITFDANGGTVSTTSGTTGDGGTLVSLPIPTRNGYIFAGWYTVATDGTVVTTGTVFSADATVYAQWQWNPAFTDSRDGKTYKRVQINNQTWMAENLNYAVEGSKCYGEGYVYIDGVNATLSAFEVQANCAQYGRLYYWSTAMAGASSSSLSPSGVQGVCPVGWHLPSDAEWTTLKNYVGGSSTAGTKLKSSTGWTSYSGVPVGTNEYGWSALPGGLGGGSDDYIYFQSAGHTGYWWSATEDEDGFIFNESMESRFESMVMSIGAVATEDVNMLSVRCVQDE